MCSPKIDQGCQYRQFALYFNDSESVNFEISLNTADSALFNVMYGKCICTEETIRFIHRCESTDTSDFGAQGSESEARKTAHVDI